MTSLDDQLARHLHRAADTVHVSWDHAASRVERRARERARRRTAARVGAAVAAGAATVAGLAAVTTSPAGLAPAAGPSTVPAAGPTTTLAPLASPTAPRIVLGGRTPTHAESVVSPSDPSVSLTFTAYRRPGASGPADPYVMVVTADAKGYSVADGVLQEQGDHRSIGWLVGTEAIDVRSFDVPADELGRLAALLKDQRAQLPAEIDGWERSEIRAMSTASRYDSITYDDGTVEIHNVTGTDIACLIDDRLSQTHTTELVTVAGHDAVLIDVSTDGSPRFWVAWHDTDGLTEIDIQGVPRGDVDRVLSNVVSVDAGAYEALFPTAAEEAPTSTTSVAS